MKDEDSVAGGARARLLSLLDRMIGRPGSSDEVEREILDTFGQESAVLVLDMCNFTRFTRGLGIVRSISMIRRVQHLFEPLLSEGGGTLVKTEADNFYCLFGKVEEALGSAAAFMRHLRDDRRCLVEEQRISVSAGIGYGIILNVGGEDIFGEEVNLASKLGEDLAGGGEILLTPAARSRLDREDLSFIEGSALVSGLPLSFYRLAPD